MIPYVGWLLAIGYIVELLIKDKQGRGKTPESHSPLLALPMLLA
jgi:hypothetical protein